jgi:transaldolase
MPFLDDLKVKIFSDCASIDGMLAMYANPLIQGFTTNPTLMRKAGVADYEAFGRAILRAIPDKPVSLEVFADDLTEMEAQALTLASWGANVVVKVPVTNTRGQFTGPILRSLSQQGIVLNVTAVLTLAQVRQIFAVLAPLTPAIVSIFAGRIADTGIDPVPIMAEALRILAPFSKAELLWASAREILNLFQADQIGCHIITATPEVLAKLSLVGRDLDQYSLETIKMFYDDSVAAGYTIDTTVGVAR